MRVKCLTNRNTCDNDGTGSGRFIVETERWPPIVEHSVTAKVTAYLRGSQ